MMLHVRHGVVCRHQIQHLPSIILVHFPHFLRYKILDTLFGVLTYWFILIESPYRRFERLTAERQLNKWPESYRKISFKGE